MKRYFLEFDVRHPELSPGIGGCYDHLKGDYSKSHVGGYCANSLKTIRQYIRKIRSSLTDLEPFGFRVYDYDAPDEADGHVGQIYFEE
ncbi:hypothetical protein SAMN02910447_03136 [Ruminococcus sp. YE71]|uniref:hypothetical protein n=1 Tax=unclassified Ruminococcus TaxID=2608920 RepID=UPI00087F0DCB|nr:MULTISPECIES: hypothetical protein [unclassified Ruminococcus]SDA30031.1 hypothetical protein SAMN02910446_03207 [Ruminococcus sp. YE78]SFW49103.1 hypothetical protein SAMN02910447_03136 [Ruminococcus sp. YE71]